MEKEVEFQFKEFKRYAGYLLENPEMVNRLANPFLDQISNSDIPVRQFLDEHPTVQLGSSQHQASIKKFLQDFLKKSLNDTAFNTAALTLNKWRGRRNGGNLRKNMEVSGILKIYQIQKQLLINNLYQFTQEVFIFSSIVQELDQFQSQLEEYAYKTEELYREENLISSLLAGSKEGIITFDKQTRVTQVNTVIEEWSSQSNEEILGRPFFDVFPYFNNQDKSAEEDTMLNKVLRGEKIQIRERALFHKGGYYEVNMVPLLSREGKVSGGVCMVDETTEKRKTESELKESQMLFHKVVNNSPTILFVYDFEQKRNVFINNTIEKVLGYKVDQFYELSQDIYHNIFHPEDIEKGILYLEQMKKLKDGEVLSAEYRMKNRNGNWHWFRSLDTVFKRNEKGEVIQMLSNAQDITIQKEAEVTILQKNQELAAALEKLQITEGKLRLSNAALEERVDERTKELIESEKELTIREEQVRSIADAVPVFIALINRDLTFGFINKPYEDFLRVKREEIIGKHVKEILGAEEFKEQEEYIKRCLQGEIIKYEMSHDRFGTLKWFFVTLLPKKIDGKVVGIYVLVEDITEPKFIQIELETLLFELEEANNEKGKALYELEKRNKELQKINSNLDNFVYVASHDLISPVTNLDSLVEILREKFIGKGDSEDVEILSMTGNAISRLKKTIADLLEVIKAQRKGGGVVAMEGDPVPFEEVFLDVKEDIKSLIEKHQAIIKDDFKVEEVYYQRSNLRSIIYNLLSNAIKYRYPDRPLIVEITTYLEGDYVVLSVEDNGLGLSSDQLKNLFYLFNRMHQHVEGSGVGLYSIKRIVENSGGKIDVKSEEGKGSQFLVYLPYRR